MANYIFRVCKSYRGDYPLVIGDDNYEAQEFHSTYVFTYEGEEAASLQADASALVDAERCLYNKKVKFICVLVFELDDDNIIKTSTPVHIVYVRKFNSDDVLLFVPGYRINNRLMPEYSVSLKQNREVGRTTARVLKGVLELGDLMKKRAKNQPAYHVYLNANGPAVTVILPIYLERLGRINNLNVNLRVTESYEVVATERAVGEPIASFASYHLRDSIKFADQDFWLIQQTRNYIEAKQVELLQAWSKWELDVTHWLSHKASKQPPHIFQPNLYIANVARLGHTLVTVLDWQNIRPGFNLPLYKLESDSYSFLPNVLTGELAEHSEIVNHALSSIIVIYELSRVETDLFQRLSSINNFSHDVQVQIYAEYASHLKAAQLNLLKLTQHMAIITALFHLKKLRRKKKMYATGREAPYNHDYFEEPLPISFIDAPRAIFKAPTIFSDEVFDFVPARNEALIFIPAAAPDVEDEEAEAPPPRERPQAFDWNDESVGAWAGGFHAWRLGVHRAAIAVLNFFGYHGADVAPVPPEGRPRV